MSLSEFVSFTRGQLADLLDEPGCVLYSGITTLKKGDLYILGLNPRGSKARETLSDSLEQLPSRGENAYDSRWKNYQPGNAPIQRRLRWLLEQLGYDLRAACASNLIFTSSQDGASSGYPELADVCWPVHERILELVRPRLILTFGNGGKSPYRYLRDKWPKDRTAEKCFPAGHGGWQCRAFHAKVCTQAALILGLPHLARYDIIAKNDVVNRIRTMIKTPA